MTTPPPQRFAATVVKACYALRASVRYRRIKDFFRAVLEDPKSPMRRAFDLSMVVLVLFSVGLLVYEVRNDLGAFGTSFEAFIVTLFVLEYLLRLWIYSDAHEILLEHYERADFLGIPFRFGPPLRAILRTKWEFMTTPLAIIDLLAILPSYRSLRILRVFLLFRLFKLFRYARSVTSFSQVLAEKRVELSVLGVFMAFMLLVSASALYYFEADYPGEHLEDFFDALYWALVTLSTVGYGDITPQTTEGRLVTMFLIVAGLGVISFFTSIIVSAFNEKLPEIRRQQACDAVQRRARHTLVCGFGRVGQDVARRLARDKARFVVVDADEERVRLARLEGFLAIQGDATSDDLLERLNIAQAVRVLCLAGNDVVNVSIALSARQLNPGVEIIARANHKENIGKLNLAGADHTVAPYQSISLVAAEYVGQPVAFEVVYGMFTGDERVRLDAVRVHPGGRLDGRPLGSLDFSRYRLILFGVVSQRDWPAERPPWVYPLRTGAAFHFNPPADFRLQAGDRILVFGHGFSVVHFKDRLDSGSI